MPPLIRNSIEALARICLTGLILDPEVPISTLFSFSLSKSARIVATNADSNDDGDPPLVRSGSLGRGHTFRRVYHHVAKPFSIPMSSHARTPSFVQVPPDTPPSSALHGKNQSEDAETLPTFLSRAMKSDVLESDPDALVSLPFKLDIKMARSKIVRNIPYLRQGWGRIDFLAVIGFWVSFGLATAGLERGTLHIGIFRALSVLRTARLIGITNGTTVSDILVCLYVSHTAGLDNHALPQNCATLVGECDIFYHICYGAVLVSLSLYHMVDHPPTYNGPALLGCNRSKGPCVVAAIFCLFLGRIPRN